MRIALIPNIGLADPNFDSDYYEYSKLIRAAAAFYNDMYFYLVLSDRFKNAKLDPLPRTKIMFVEETSSFSINQLAASQELIFNFHYRGGHIHTDGMVTSRANVALFFNAAVTDPQRRYAYPTVFRQPCLEDESQLDESGIVYDMMQSMVFAACNPIVKGQQAYERSRLMAGRYLSPTCVEWFDQSVFVTTSGLELDYFDMLLKKNEKHEKFTLFSGTRINTTKRVEKVFQLYDKFYSSGRNVQVVVTAPNPEGSVFGKKFVSEYLQGAIKWFYTSCPRDKYFEEASKAHVFLVASIGENISNFLVEQLYLGLIGIVPDMPYVWEMLPRDYPFCYRSFDEAYTILMWIQEHYDEARAKVEPYRQMIREKYAESLVFKQEVDHIRKVVMTSHEAALARPSSTLLDEVVKQALLEFDVDFKLDTFISVANKQMSRKIMYTTPDKIFGKAMTPIDIRLGLERLGYRDNCKTDEPIYSIYKEV